MPVAKHPFLKRFLLGLCCSVVLVLALAGFTVKGMPLNAEAFTLMATARTVELDFSETDTAYYEFDNNAPGPFNFGEIEIDQPRDSEAWLELEFLVDSDRDGVYKPVSETGKYTFSDMEPGASSLTKLPHGSSLKPYCLRITNLTPDVDSARLMVSLRW